MAYQFHAAVLSQPGIFGLSRFRSILSCRHPAIYVRLNLMEIALFLKESRAYFPIILPGSFAATENCLPYYDPWIIMGEDSGILLIPGGICGDFAVFFHVFGECLG